MKLVGKPFHLVIEGWVQYIHVMWIVSLNAYNRRGRDSSYLVMTTWVVCNPLENCEIQHAWKKRKNKKNWVEEDGNCFRQQRRGKTYFDVGKESKPYFLLKNRLLELEIPWTMMACLWIFLVEKLTKNICKGNLGISFRIGFLGAPSLENLVWYVL